MANWTRIVMNCETNKLVSSLSYQEYDVLEISGNAWKNYSFRTYESVGYPEFDICTESKVPQSYNLIIAEQVFEHVLWPYRAGRNVYQMLRPGGHFLITTPFLLPIHDYPVDCSRWTPLGLKYFLAECGFNLENIKVESWGNQSCVKANLKGWTPYSKWRHSLKNSEKHPVVVWALATK